ncbi:MAG TPA: DNA-formamidopyrimidine glycosylase family protein [Actinomycetota bacterium]|jgi:formamidopyrimidine-DNA glycosylase|nr:DNA-formamidopyrimidine glycosylase family protein [Actinomycetota bacterium]
MPELPEVEGFRAVAEQTLLGRKVIRARFFDDWMLKESSPSTAARRMKGRRISAVDRKGKMLAIFTDPVPGRPDTPVLALHFGMTGRPIVARIGDPIHHWDRLLLDLDSGAEFRYRNSRRLGFIRVVTRNEMADLAWRLGPDPLEAPASYLVEALEGREAPIKALLLDQSFLAGIGNIYADEALHAAGIRPSRPGSDLDPEEIRALHRALQRILKRAVSAHRGGRDSMFPLLNVRRHASKQLGASGSPKVGCPRCDRPLRHAKIGGRTSFYCAKCQS